MVLSRIRNITFLKQISIEVHGVLSVGKRIMLDWYHFEETQIELAISRFSEESDIVFAKQMSMVLHASASVFFSCTQSTVRESWAR